MEREGVTDSACEKGVRIGPRVFKTLPAKYANAR